MPGEEGEREDEVFAEAIGPSFDDQVMKKFEGIVSKVRSSSPEKNTFISRRSASMPVEDHR